MNSPNLDVIVPEFNERSRQGDRFDVQVEYLSILSSKYDVILIDDASSDGSWERLLGFTRGRPRLHMLRMEKNGHKVLAIKRALELSHADYVLLSDFDSTLITPETVERALRRFEQSPNLACLALRLLPEGRSYFSKFQDVEYAIGRAVFNGYLEKQRMLRCVAGAAGIWRRKVLLEVLEEHSGRHNGDDLEATAIAMRKGYDVGYEPSVVVKTLVPQTPMDLFHQRKRWELGALETYAKERGFYIRQVRNLRSRLGHVTILDWYAWVTMVLTPIFVVNGLWNPTSFWEYSCFQLFFTIGAGYLSRREVRYRWALALVPVFPIYQFLATLPRLAALCEFLGRGISKGPAQTQRALMIGVYSVQNLSPVQRAALQRLARIF